MLCARAGGDGGGLPVLVSVARWIRPDREPRVVYRAAAPVDPRDTARDVRDRSEELAGHVMEAALAALDRGAGADPDADPTADLSAWRPLTRAEHRRWRVRQAVGRARRNLGFRLLAKRAFLLAGLGFYRPLRDFLRLRRRRHPVRIFTYHRVTDLCRDSLSASRRTFRAQLAYIRRTHDVLPLHSALMLLADGTPLERPVAVITFDDAYRSVAALAAPVMAELDLPGSCFAPTAYVGARDRFPWDHDNPVVDHLDVMDWVTLGRLHEGGWTIGAHSRTHARLSDCDDPSLTRELGEPLDTLRQRLGLHRVALAYPFGGPADIDERGVREVEALGYSCCLSNHGGENWAPRSPYRLARIDIGGDHDTLTWKGRVHGIDPARAFRRLTGRS